MRMSDNVDTETMKVSEAAEPASSAKDAKTEVSDQSQNSRDEHGCNNKKDIQVKCESAVMKCKVLPAMCKHSAEQIPE